LEDLGIGRFGNWKIWELEDLGIGRFRDPEDLIRRSTGVLFVDGVTVMTAEEMKKRTKAFSLAIITLISELPETLVARRVADQLIRCGTSVGANYRAVCRAKSKADFISKLSIVLEEADESLFWLEIISESGLFPSHRINPLQIEINEIISILVTSIKTSKNNSNNKSK
jgi:four helix bundle protein